MTSPSFSELSGLLGQPALTSPENLKQYGVGGLTPRAVVQPSTRQEVAEALGWASSNGMAVCPVGGGTRLSLGNVPRQLDLAVDLTGLGQVLDYQPADLTVSVEAGATLATLQQELASAGKFLPLEAPLSDRATIGGILATGVTGPLRHAYGLPRDWLIGISVVGADGIEARAGGRVVKNVTGYDLNKLYTGSLGTLGVIVEATFKLSPLPARTAAMVARFGSLPSAVSRATDLLGQVYAPQGLHLVYGAGALDRLGVPEEPRSPAALLAYFSGSNAAVARRMDECSAPRPQAGDTVEQLDEAAALALLRRHADLGWGGDGLPYLSIRASVPPASAGRLVGSSRVLGEASSPDVVADLGFGVVHFYWWQPPEEAWEGWASSVIAWAQETSARLGGWAMVEHCPLLVKAELDVWGPEPSALALMRRIKNKLDPQGILNPGRFLGRL